jgi:hypothetical protein
MGSALGKGRGLDPQRREGLIRCGSSLALAAKLRFQGGDALIALIGHSLRPSGIAFRLLVRLALGLEKLLRNDSKITETLSPA